MCATEDREGMGANGRVRRTSAGAWFECPLDAIADAPEEPLIDERSCEKLTGRAPGEIRGDTRCERMAESFGRSPPSWRPESRRQFPRSRTVAPPKRRGRTGQPI